MIDLIKTATLSPEDSSRRNAEAAIVKFRSEQPEPFLLQTGHIFQSSEVESSIRQASANLLALSILSEVLLLNT